MLLYRLYIIKAKGLIITLLDKLIQQVENVLHKQKALEQENKKLKKELEQLLKQKHSYNELKSKNIEYSQTIAELTLKLKKFL